jgi:uncharacterized protein (TIGR00369 family)
MKEMIEKYRQMNHFGRHMSMDFHITEPGNVEYAMVVDEQHMATLNAAHGGAIAGMMDGILGVAALSAVAEDGKLVATIEFKISFFAPAGLNDILIGNGKVLKKGKKIVFTEGEIRNQEDVLIAKASGTFSSYEPK